MTELASPPVALVDGIDSAREIVQLTQQLLDGREIARDFSDDEPQAADAALSAARRALSEHLDATGPEPEVSALMLRSELTQVSVKDAILARHSDMVRGTQEALAGLRRISSVAALAGQAPVAAYRMGFSRILFSQIREGIWFPCSACAGDDEEFAQTMVQVGVAHPRRLTGPLLESEMVRRAIPILVSSPQSNPRVHPELVAVTKTKAYVAAPVLAWGRPIGLLHADRGAEQRGVSEFDRDALGVFAEGLGVAFERNMMVDRLQAMRHSAEEHLRAANALADDFTLEVMEFAGVAAKPVEDRLNEQGMRGGLTAREADVLQAMAAGKTNAQIARSLFVAEGTVKSHVKHILRKLGAANRTDAVAKYHLLRG
jgi:DNA-binding CsgD family transcriptional regulator/GAF domain-containing protein